jgi:tRNA(Ile)-lysidine synthetase-like protein
MIKIQGKFERNVLVACSGGVDSMAVVDFLSRKHEVTMMFFDHGTETSREALEFLEEYVTNNKSKNILLEVGTIQNQKSADQSKEEYWRNERYNWFHSYNHPIITCHHLDDCLETWIWSSLHGEGKIIPYANRNVIRPFRLNRKAEFLNWCRNKDVPWIEDVTNSDNCHIRNFIRNEIVQKALVVNPGLHKVIAKKVDKSFY